MNMLKIPLLKRVSLFTLIITIFSLGGVSSCFAQTDTAPISPENLSNLIKPSVVKVFNRVQGTITVPNFNFDFVGFKMIPAPNNKVGVFPIDSDDEGNTIPAEDTGSGFIISPDGYIITNSHVILSPVDDLYRRLAYAYLLNQDKVVWEAALNRYKTVDDAYQAAFQTIYTFIKQNAVKNFNQSVYILKPNSSGKTIDELGDAGYEAKVIYSNDTFADDSKDIALLKIEAANLPSLPLAPDTESVTTGQRVYLLGYPGNATISDTDFLTPTFSAGTINALKKQHDISIYQTDAKVSPGSSGSPMIDANGNVVGILTYDSGQTDSGDNFGFAIPVELVKKVLSQNNITPAVGDYFTHYSQGLTLLAQKHAKSAILEFDKANSVNPDFSVNSYVNIAKSQANDLIKSGQSIDSMWDKVKNTLSNNLVVTISIVLGLIVLILLVWFIFFLMKKMKREEKMLSDAQQAQHAQSAQEVQNGHAMSTPTPTTTPTTIEPSGTDKIK